MLHVSVADSNTEGATNNSDDVVDRYMNPNKVRCLCEGHYHSSTHERHVIWLAFVANDSPSEFWADGWCMMQAASFIFNTNIGHCQLVFYDNGKQQFYTYSADKTQGVSCSFTKTYKRSGWRFLAIDVTEAQEMAIKRALISEVGKPFDKSAAYMLPFWPRRTTRTAWFCSELMLTALKAGGLALNAPDAYSMPPHKLYAFMRNQYRDSTCEELSYVDNKNMIRFSNPVALNERLKNNTTGQIYDY